MKIFILLGCLLCSVPFWAQNLDPSSENQAPKIWSPKTSETSACQGICRFQQNGRDKILTIRRTSCASVRTSCRLTLSGQLRGGKCTCS